MGNPEEFEFTKIEFSDPFAKFGSNEIKVRVKNNSKRFTLTALCLYVQVVDYYNGQSEIIGIDELFISLNVPPQQTHDFKGKPHLGTLPAPKGKYAWLCSIGPVQSVDYKNAVRTN